MCLIHCGRYRIWGEWSDNTVLKNGRERDNLASSCTIGIWERKSWVTWCFPMTIVCLSEQVLLRFQIPSLISSERTMFPCRIPLSFNDYFKGGYDLGFSQTLPKSEKMVIITLSYKRTWLTISCDLGICRNKEEARHISEKSLRRKEIKSLKEMWA